MTDRMEQLLLDDSLDIDQKATANRVRNFLAYDFDHLLNIAGFAPNDLSVVDESHISSPRMDVSGVSAHGGVNHTEQSFNRIIEAEKACHAIKIRELAAILTQNGFIIGQNQLYQLLRLEHYISKHGTLPIGDKIKRGYFRIVHGVKHGHAWSTTLVTPEGQKHIISKALRGAFDDSYQKVVAE